MLTQYWNTQESHEKIYGEKTIVLIEKGSFYESYCTETKGNAKELARMLNMTLTKANKNKELSDNNPYMAGFPTGNKNKHIGILSDNGYTIVMIEQIWNEQHTEIKERKITRVITPGTYIEEPPDEDMYNICCIYMQKMNQIGICTIDVTIGKVILISYKSKEDINRYISTYSPKEIIVLKNSKVDNNISTHDTIVRYIEEEKEYREIEYQNMIFNKVYDTYQMNLDNNEELRISFSYLLNFIWKCHPRALDKLELPKIKTDEKHLILHNTAISQLNLISTYKRGINSLFDVIDKTVTSMGKRELKLRMLTPITNVEELTERYDNVDQMVEYIEEMNKYMKSIPDLERISKKMYMGMITIIEFTNLYETYEHMLTLFEFTDKTNMKYTKSCRNKIEQIINEFKSIYKFDENCFQESVNKELYTWKERINEIKANINQILLDYSKKINNSNDCVFHLDRNEKDGYFVYGTEKRCAQLKKCNTEQITIKKQNSNYCRFSTTELSEFCFLVTQIEQDYNKLFKNIFIIELKELYIKNISDINLINEIIKELDVTLSIAKIRNEYGYSRPIIKESNKSYINAMNVRHPIVERLEHSCNYIGNDVKFDHETNGMLLYGVNGSGKSTYGKGIACCLIMAQMGCYVPATYFEYNPYHQLFVRINSDDNMFKSLSSFGVEMMELKQIIQCADEKSIVIGDELCKGTEDLSATSIVSASIKWLIDNKVAFIFATHLHKLLNLTDEFTKNKKLVIKHLKAEFNTKLNKMVYHRSLEEGSGDELYGVEIARNILQCPELINNAMEIRNNITGRTNKIVNYKKSRYNKKLIMDCCVNCKTTHNLHTHHIIEQNEYDRNIQIVENITKNQKSNLMVLCQKCHEKIHHNELKVEVIDTGGKCEYLFT